MITQLIYAIAIMYCSHFASLQFNYDEYRDIYDSTNNFYNLRVTYELCAQINDTNDKIVMCQQYAYRRVLSHVITFDA